MYIVGHFTLLSMVYYILCSYAKFKIEVGIYHGGKPICKRVFSPPAKVERRFFSTIMWNKWYNFLHTFFYLLYLQHCIFRIKTGLSLVQIPREAKVCFTLYGLNPPTNPKEYRDTLDPIAWVAKQLFTSNGYIELYTSSFGLFTLGGVSL